MWGSIYQYSNKHPDKLDMSGSDFELGDGSYAKLLYFNVVGFGATLGLYLMFFTLEYCFMQGCYERCCTKLAPTEKSDPDIELECNYADNHTQDGMPYSKGNGLDGHDYADAADNTTDDL